MPGDVFVQNSWIQPHLWDPLQGISRIYLCTWFWMYQVLQVFSTLGGFHGPLLFLVIQDKIDYSIEEIESPHLEGDRSGSLLRIQPSSAAMSARILGMKSGNNLFSNEHTSAKNRLERFV